MRMRIRGVAAGLAWAALTPWAMAQAPAPAPVAAPAPRAAEGRNPGDLPGPIDNLQDLQDTGKMLFKLADTNNDDRISQKEATDLGNLLVGGFFFRADANGDGTVTPEEMRQARDQLLAQKPLLRYVLSKGRAEVNAERAQRGETNNQNPAQGLVNLLDTNNDKKIEATEVRQAVQAAVQGTFATADTNRDGQLEPSEINAAMAGAARTAAQAAFQAADSDKNGTLSRQEFDKAIVEPANIAFAALDLNNDGQLSPDETQRAERFIIRQIRLLRVPEPANSPRRLIETGRLPSEVAPVPSIPPIRREAARPAAPTTPPGEPPR